MSLASKIFSNLRVFLNHPPSLAVGLVFSLESFLFGCWVSRIPMVKTTLGLNDAELGIALFGLPVGLLLSSPFAGWVSNRFGAGTTSVICTALTAVVLPIPVLMPNMWALFAALALYGAIISCLNVAMNTCAVVIEERDSKNIMATCHGMWSVGGMTGSLLSGLIIGLQLPAIGHLAVASILSLVCILWTRTELQKLNQRAEKGTKSGFVMPTRALFLMILLGFIAATGEGIAFDWSGVYMRDCKQASESLAAFGFGVFMAGMTIGRFSGDTIIPIWGTKRLLTICYSMAATGLIVCIAAPTATLTLVGYLLLGLGSSLCAPILYGASMRIVGVSPAAGLATYTTFSFVGFLVGPPCIGFIAESHSLHIGLAVVALLLFVAVGLVQQLRL